MQFNNYIIDTLRNSSMQILRVCVHLMSCYLSFRIREIDGERERYYSFHPFNPYCACALVCRCVHLYILIEFSYAHLLQLPSFHTSFQHHLSRFLSFHSSPTTPFSFFPSFSRDPEGSALKGKWPIMQSFQVTYDGSHLLNEIKFSLKKTKKRKGGN